MATYKITDTKTGETLATLSGMCVNSRDARDRLMTIRRPLIAAKYQAEGKAISSITLVRDDAGRYEITEQGGEAARYRMAVKTFVPQVRSAREQFDGRDPAHLKQDAFYTPTKGR